MLAVKDCGNLLVSEHNLQYWRQTILNFRRRGKKTTPARKDTKKETELK